MFPYSLLEPGKSAEEFGVQGFGASAQCAEFTGLGLGHMVVARENFVPFLCPYKKYGLKRQRVPKREPELRG